MKKILYRLFIYLWVGVMLFLGIHLFFFAEKKATVEESENRTLAPFPEISSENVFGGGFSQGMESWMSDHTPFRKDTIGISRSLRQFLSLASVEEQLADMTRTDDALSEPEVSEEELAAAARAHLWKMVHSTEEEDIYSISMTDPSLMKNAPKPAVSENDFPSSFPVHLEIDGKKYDYYSFSRRSVLAVTNVLDRVAALLPDDGTLVFTMVPQSSIGTRFANAKEKTDLSCRAEEAVEAFGADNVHAVSATNILAEAMKNGEYVYFRTDMHWTPYGTYLVYREMADLAWVKPADWDDYEKTVETPFRGTYYRDNPNSYMRDNPDDLTLVTPKFGLEWRRITGPDEYKVIPFLNMNAKKNDRYTVYLGGPAGPWTYAQCDNGKENNCLVITDSFGLAFVPMVTQNYGQVHYYDPRYFDRRTVGGSVADMIKKYDIKDVYVVVGDLHAYSSGFLITQLSNQLGDK
ncbi:MAG: hypothetical protein II164_04910 [Firmicutes bacterium]|nr:hypothetical protein [Bacillota bacterium]